MKIKISNKNKGQVLLKKAKKIIPGGGQLLSKRSELFLPGYWPAYYKKAKGSIIWDLENNRYYDFAGMGTLSCVLGYADSFINNRVIKAINLSSMGTLNSYEEVDFAEMLIAIHPWAQMARFARTGGEACSIAIRIARASSGKDKILFCGYHGWHDWYLAANMQNNENLSEQLLPGLTTKGVPKNLIDSSIPFKYNDYEDFKRVFDRNSNKIGVVIMEPQRSTPPDLEFLKYVRKKTKEIGAVFIFDEITSGFHENYGGRHIDLKINPDIAIFSKAIGNGYPISAIIGTKEVMESAQSTFVSSLMWTERIGFVAGIATLQKMKKFNVQNKTVKFGKRIKKGWKKASDDLGLDITIRGMNSIPEFCFNYENNLELSTFFIQEMLKKGFLANLRLATTYAYTNKIINDYMNACYDTFKKIKNYQDKNIKIPLKGQIKHDTFRRLN